MDTNSSSTSNSNSTTKDTNTVYIPDLFVYSAVSADGYTATTDGSIEWLNELSSSLKSDSIDNDMGYSGFLSNISHLIMGRKTYEQILSFDCPWPYAGKHTYVFSLNAKTDKSSIPLPKPNQIDSTSKITIIKGNVSDSLSQIKQSAADAKGGIWIVGGSQIIGELSSHINRIILTIQPIILHSGIPLLQSLSNSNKALTKLKLVKSSIFMNGMVQIEYTLDV